MRDERLEREQLGAVGHVVLGDEIASSPEELLACSGAPREARDREPREQARHLRPPCVLTKRIVVDFGERCFGLGALAAQREDDGRLREERPPRVRVMPWVSEQSTDPLERLGTGREPGALTP